MPKPAFQELVDRLAQALPPGLANARVELKDNFRAIIEAQLGDLNLVSREEFEVQREVLKRLRERQRALEARIKALE